MCDENIDQNRDRIAETFKGRTLLISGGTGFVGKVLIEKILRVQDVKKIFVLVRTRKGKNALERYDQIFGDPLFDLVKKIHGKSVIERAHFVSANMSEPHLGLAAADRQMLTEETEFIFHCAATIRFDEKLKTAVFVNVRGTKCMLDLAKECKKLKVFVHLSTAYCHLHERVLYEKTYPPPADPDTIIRMCELINEDVVDQIAPKILEDIPNSYAFTKGLGEGLVNEQMDTLPVIILRPSIIMPCLGDPIPGWTDNFNGPMGLLIAGGKGVLRTMYCNSSTYADYVPVDIVANTIILAAADYIQFKAARRVYNICSSAEYKITFEELVHLGRQTVYNRLPFNGVFWYPGGNMTQSRLKHNLAFFFFQWVPAVIIDVLLVCLGYPPVLKKVQRRIRNGYDVFEYYANRQWDFNCDASMDARKLLTNKEREIYRVDGVGVKYEDYFYDCIHSSRLYLLHESDESIPAAKRHMKVMYVADRVCKTLIIIGFLYLLWKVMFLPLFNAI